MITNNNNITEWSMLVDAVLPMLLEECKTDLGLRAAMRSANKSLENMANYIYRKVKKMSSGQKCAVLSDQKVLEIAREYFICDNDVLETALKYFTPNNEENDEQDAE